MRQGGRRGPDPESGGVADECRRVRLSLLWLSGGRLAPEERLALYQHLSACPACRRELAGYLALASAVTKAVEALPQPPQGLAEAVLARMPGTAVTDETGRGQVATGLSFMRSLLESVRAAGLPGLALGSFQWALSVVASVED